VRSTAVFQPDFRLPTVVAERQDQSEPEHMLRLWARLVVQGTKPATEAAREARDQASTAVAEIQTLAHLFVISHLNVDFDTDLIDELLGAKPYQEAFLAFHRAARSLVSPRPARKQSETMFPQTVLDHEATRERLRFIDRLTAQVDTAADVLAKRAGELPRFMVETPESEQERNLLWFVYDPGVPAEIAEALLGLRRSETAFVLLRAAADYWPPTVLRMLSHAWADEYEKYACYVAGFPFVSVTMVPEENKLRVAELVTKQNQTLEHLRAEGDKAIAALGR
jgi:hypothetical protein